MANTPQDQFYNDQDIVSPDIEVYYNENIKYIDKFRSRFNGITTNLSRSISLKNIDTVFVNNESHSLSPQESRCHTFYRMIGFPVVSADGSKLYSPGFDPDLNRDTNRIAKNLEIANSIINQLKSILNDRELYPKNSINLFQNKDATSSALAISSIYVRPFDKQFKEGLNPLQADQQSFEVPDRATVSSEFSETLNFSSKSRHILKPFVVDPRIELTVTPAANRVCAPFLLDKSKTQLSNSTYLTRPYIEKVMSVRFNNTNVLNSPADQESANQFIKDLISFIQSNSQITKPSLVEITANSLQSLHRSEIIILAKFIRIIKALIQELVQSITEINKIKKHINWKPKPYANGPEFGSSINAVDPSDTLNNKTIETNISALEIQKFIAETDFDIGLDAPNAGNFAFSNIDDIVFGSIKTNSQFYDKQLSILNRRREELGGKANNLLRNIEIITGEFSGLGLLDIFAIRAAMWAIKPGALLGLIDDAAIARMQQNNKLKVDTGSRLDPKSSLAEFEKKIAEIYVLMNAFYQDMIGFDGKNKQ